MRLLLRSICRLRWTRYAALGLGLLHVLRWQKHSVGVVANWVVTDERRLGFCFVATRVLTNDVH